jgi:3-methylcrotonyl-CoA carboxylase alpha subunit
LDGVWRTVLVTHDSQVITLRDQGETWRLTLPDALSTDDEEDDAGDRLIAPIPGQVTQVSVKAGDRVERGDILVVMEAMKTVFRLAAPADAVVAEVPCAVGETVQEGQMLVGFAQAAES